MYEVTVEDVFSSAHRLRNYKGKCENLHGHNWKVRVTVSGQNLDNIGLLIDFHVVKEKLRDVIDILDHTDLNSISFFKKINPTSENICFYIYRKMKAVLKKYSVEIKRVDVWENDKQYASYFEG